MKKYFLILLLAVLACSRQQDLLAVEQWKIYELLLEGPSSGNPFTDVELSAVFKSGEKSITVAGFYDGNGNYRIRFSPPDLGKWTYETNSNSIDLTNKKGQLLCVPATSTNHGPLKIVNTFYLQHADGTPFYATGTTAYQWTSVKQEVQEATLKTLAEAPFNKIRMCIFPKSYSYGNETEPWLHPFLREEDKNDFSRPNYEFFQNFDKRVEQLMQLRIQADVILFHPYDSWGYSEMGNEMNLKYVRYMIARLSAYSNVWWSLANEWDVPEIKDAIDWEAIGTLLQQEDPHQRLRGIHNWYDTEDHFYDHTRPWITHVSAQTAQFYNAIKWRNRYKKPLLFDEMRYEGDVASSWGNMTGQEMTSYFWKAGLSGGYPTHGETFQNTADDLTEVRWWAKGGKLMGDSAERIAFFKDIMETAPIHEMAPSIVINGEAANQYNNIYMLAEKGEYYLAYTEAKAQLIEVNLNEDIAYKLEFIDTWNMEINSSSEKYSGTAYIQMPDQPYIALRIARVK